MKKLYYEKGDLLWLLPDPKNTFSLPWAGKVVQKLLNKIIVLKDDGQKETVSVDCVVDVVDQTENVPVEDMISLSNLEEHSILRNIYLRYLQNNVYTYIGWILVAVNPYHKLPIYSENEVKLYHNMRIGELPPHLYAIGAQCVTNLRTTNQNQCVLISGETGAGKTESTKLLLNFLASISSKESTISRKIISANPILEAFGNACTTENDNSSRFGKYIEVYFSEEGTISGARIQHFLLERSRVKAQNEGDKNYHIFYYLLTGLSNQEKNKLSLQSLGDYNYLNQNGITAKEKIRKEELQLLMTSLEELNFLTDEITDIFKALSAIIHLGNISFRPATIDNNDCTEVTKGTSYNAALALLDVPANLLLEALTKKKIFVMGQNVSSYLSMDSACANRDGFATTVYGHIFSFILTKINKTILNHTSEKKASIGILDIFGFENFNNNSFEQLCINFSNEYLQQYFVENIFKLEQMEYEKEAIPWTQLEFLDNQPILDLLGLNRLSILNLIDEQTRVPKGSDKGFLLRFNELYSSNPYYIPAKGDMSMVFGIKHYAGSVIYNVKGFLEKNHSDLSPEWVDVVKGSKSEFLKEIFSKQLTTWKKSSQSLIHQYKLSMDSLMKTLKSCNPFFVRCIKPNKEKKPMVFDQPFCCRQLRYFGFTATVKIRKAGYPIRYNYSQFIKKYNILLAATIRKTLSSRNEKDSTELICNQHLSGNSFQLGKTKVFLKMDHEYILEKKINQIYSQSATTIQKNWRAFMTRRWYIKLRRSTLLIQRNWRSYLPRRKFQLLRRGVMRLQSTIRSRRRTAHLKSLKNRIIRFQARCRGFLIRRDVKKQLSSQVVTIEKPTVKNGDKFDEIDSWINNIFEDAVLENPNKMSDKKVILLSKNPSQNTKNYRNLNRSDSSGFGQYAASNFVGNVGYKHSNKALEQPLLNLNSPSDCWAATAIWITTLRFMGDMSEPVLPGDQPRSKNLPILKQLSKTLPRNYNNSKEYTEAVKALQLEEKERSIIQLKNGPTKLMYLTLVHRNKLHSEVRRSQLEGLQLKASYDDWILRKNSSALEKVHFIIGHGILKPELRDEIYCQLCKQLIENPDTNSEFKGWVLMSLCCSTFGPSEKLCPTLIDFLHQNGNKINCLDRLERTLANGPRSQPPSAFELEALKKKTDLIIHVTIPGDMNIYVQIDSAMTAGEVCTKICEHLKITEIFGFSLFISIYGMELSLEADNYHVMDAICLCEQYVKEKGIKELAAPFVFTFRKEIFSPWQVTPIKIDSVSDTIVYNQALNGIKNGFYQCTNDHELATFVALHYHSLYGMKIFSNIIENIATNIIPDDVLKKHNMSYWLQLINSKLYKNYYIKEKLSDKDIKMGVAKFCKTKWPLSFSKFYEVKQLSGPTLDTSPLLVAVNSDGTYFVKNSGEILLKLLYIDIIDCAQVKKHSTSNPLLLISTIDSCKYLFQTQYASYISTLVKWMKKESMKYSKYALAVENFNPPDESFLHLSIGDLIILYDFSEKNKDWFKGKKMSTDELGEFPAKTVIRLPVNSRPPKYKLELLINHHGRNNLKESFRRKTNLEDPIYLETYASRHFGSSDKSLLCYSTAPLNRPLHKVLVGSPFASDALKMYQFIRLFMEFDSNDDTWVTPIPTFQLIKKNEKLRDEFYCQLIKQLTNNKNVNSEKKAFQLMWLASGLFPCSTNLKQDLISFLISKQKVICQEIRSRLESSFEKGPRKGHCDPLEVEASFTGHKIELNVKFSNQVEQVFQIESSTTVNELVTDISEWLGLENHYGFGLAMTLKRDMLFLKDGFVLDSLQESSQTILKYYNLNDEDLKYLKLNFLKKNWTYSLPGVDQKADSLCHYYQELNKYLNGMYKCNNEELAELASYILISEGLNLETQMKQSIINDLPFYIPKKYCSNFNERDWIVKISVHHRRFQALPRPKSKEQFLKFLSKFPHFGAMYFKMKGNKYIDHIVGVNHNGIFIFNSNQDIIKKIVYPEIKEFSQKGNVFYIKLEGSRSEMKWELKTLATPLLDLVNMYSKER